MTQRPWPPQADESRDIKLSVIIANYNRRELLARCLGSIYEHAPDCAFEVLVVDDASADGSAEMVEASFPQVKLLQNPANLHYARSNNRALSVARGTYVYLLNNDTLVRAHALDRMVTFLDVHPDVGAVGSRLLNADGSTQVSAKALPSALSAVFGAKSFISRMFPGNSWTRKELLHLDSDLITPKPAGYVSGASFIVRRRVIDEIGMLDDRFFYFIDADYCKRVWDQGWGVYYLPAAEIVHFAHEGGSLITRRRRFRALLEFHVGAYLYFDKHYRGWWWRKTKWLVAAVLGVRLACSLMLQLLEEVHWSRQERASATIA